MEIYGIIKDRFWAHLKVHEKKLLLSHFWGWEFFGKQFPENYSFGQKQKGNVARHQKNNMTRSFIFEGAFQLKIVRIIIKNYTTVAFIIYFARSALLNHIFLLSLYRLRNAINCSLAILNQEGILIKNLQHKVHWFHFIYLLFFFFSLFNFFCPIAFLTIFLRAVLNGIKWFNCALFFAKYL